jgi:putative transposase
MRKPTHTRDDALPTDPNQMYRWRKLNEDQRKAVLEQRRREHRPWHSPAHYESESTTYYVITAACFEHRHVIGHSPERMAKFEKDLVELLTAGSTAVFAWCVLPNHYHALIDTPSVKQLLADIGRLHGRSSFDWNGEEGTRGRQAWCNAAETAMKSEGHYYASLNYVLNNAVHHGYVKLWTDWPYCNAREYIEAIGRAKAIRIWQSYPLYDYGKDWDPTDL